MSYTLCSSERKEPCTISELLRVVQAGVFAALFEGGVRQVLTSHSRAGGEQGGVEEGSLVVKSHAATVHEVSAATLTLKNMRWKKH